MRSARSYADEAARLHADGATYSQIITTWASQHRVSPLTAARLAHGLTQKQVAHRWNELWPDPDRPKSAKQILDGEDYSHLDPATHDGASSVQLLSVAIAVVVRDGEVLLVCRRDNTEGIRWGFPTGVVKPGRNPEHVAVSETLAETGVHCAVRSALGTRLHPMTGALCAYFLLPRRPPRR